MLAAIAFAPPRSSMISGTVAMPETYDNRMHHASGNTTFMFEGCGEAAHVPAVETSHQFLERLRSAGVTQKQIGKVLGIAQSNAATFYTPGKNGKLRTLKWDEGAKLASAFELTEADEAAPAYLNEELLVPIVQEIVEQGRSDRSGSAARPLASALSRYLQQLVGRPAIHASQDALEAVAQSVVPRPPTAKPQA